MWIKTYVSISISNQYSQLNVCLCAFCLLILHYLMSACSQLIFFSFCTLSLFCHCNDPISPDRSIKFHLSYRGIKRSQSSKWLSCSEGHKFWEDDCNISSITLGWKDKWDALLSTHHSIMMICEDLLFRPFKGLVQESVWISSPLNCCYWCSFSLWTWFTVCTYIRLIFTNWYFWFLHVTYSWKVFFCRNFIHQTQIISLPAKLR